MSYKENYEEIKGSFKCDERFTNTDTGVLQYTGTEVSPEVADVLNAEIARLATQEAKLKARIKELEMQIILKEEMINTLSAPAVKRAEEALKRCVEIWDRHGVIYKSSETYEYVISTLKQDISK